MNIENILHEIFDLDDDKSRINEKFSNTPEKLNTKRTKANYLPENLVCISELPEKFRYVFEL